MMVNLNLISAKLAELAARVARVRECRKGSADDLKADRNATELAITPL